MNKIIRIYISTEISRGVAVSQMYDWANLIETIGVKTIFAVFYRSKSRLRDMTKGVKAVFHPVRIRKFLLLRDTRILLTLIGLYVKYSEYEKIIFQSRDTQMVFPLRLIRILPKSRIIFESRAAGEYESSHKNNSIVGHLKFVLRSYREKLMLKISDQNICVSNAMIDYYILKHKLNGGLQFNTVYGAANEELFYYSDLLRKQVRERLKLVNKKVFLYSGALDKYWQVPEKIFLLFKTLHLTFDNIYFIVLSKDKEIARSLFAQQGIPDNLYLVDWVSIEALNDYYNAADYGLLLRDDLLLNRVASPTKFAEYLLSGLPVIISKCILDFSEYIQTHNYGIVLDNLEASISPPLSTNIREKLEDYSYFRPELSGIAKKKFSKQSYLEFYKNLFNKV